MIDCHRLIRPGIKGSERTILRAVKVPMKEKFFLHMLVVHYVLIPKWQEKLESVFDQGRINL